MNSEDPPASESNPVEQCYADLLALVIFEYGPQPEKASQPLATRLHDLSALSGRDTVTRGPGESDPYYYERVLLHALYHSGGALKGSRLARFALEYAKRVRTGVGPVEVCCLFRSTLWDLAQDGLIRFQDSRGAEMKREANELTLEAQFAPVASTYVLTREGYARHNHYATRGEIDSWEVKSIESLLE